VPAPHGLGPATPGLRAISPTALVTSFTAALESTAQCETSSARAPKDDKQQKEEKQPKDRVNETNADVRVEPAKDGYINAIRPQGCARLSGTKSGSLSE
jgi:hypothetical protein